MRAPLTVNSRLEEHLLSVGVTAPADLFDPKTPQLVMLNVWVVIQIGITLMVTDLFADRYGSGWPTVLRAATFVWIATFGLTWLSMFNLELANAETLLWALPGAFLELCVLCALARRLRRRRGVAARELAETHTIGG